MVTEILAIVGTLTAVGATWLTRRWKQKDDPRNQSEEQAGENRQAIANGNAGDLLERRIDRVRPSETESNGD